MKDSKKIGAPAAYRGYRLQALYIFWRILSPSNNDFFFRPEGKEDLDILDINENLIEAVQVKSFSSLVLSHLISKEPSENERQRGAVKPFIQRAIDHLKKQSCNKVMLVNFGSIGPELKQAWTDISLPNKNINKVLKKLKKKGLSSDEIKLVIKNVELISVDEKTIESEIFTILGEVITGIDPVSAFDLLNFWIYLASEKQQVLTKQKLIEKIQNVGRFLSECHVHHKEWFTTIKPIIKKKFQKRNEHF